MPYAPLTQAVLTSCLTRPLAQAVLTSCIGLRAFEHT